MSAECPKESDERSLQNVHQSPSNNSQVVTEVIVETVNNSGQNVERDRGRQTGPGQQCLVSILEHQTAHLRLTVTNLDTLCNGGSEKNCIRTQRTYLYRRNGKAQAAPHGPCLARVSARKRAQGIGEEGGAEAENGGKEERNVG